MMHISAIDLNLLGIASALYRHRNVSKAAQELGLSQSAVSHALARLRDQFGDPMFVRTSKGVAPTEFARTIQTELLDVVHKSELLMNRKKAFDPKEARGRITLATTDYFEAVVLPKLQPILAREAPGLQISVRPTVGELPKRDLEEGKIDFAVAGFYADLPEGFYKGKLFKDSFRSATRKDHPTIRTRLSVEDYFAAHHALITLQGDFRDSMISQVGKEKTHARHRLRNLQLHRNRMGPRKIRSRSDRAQSPAQTVRAIFSDPDLALPGRNRSDRDANDLACANAR